MTFKCYYHLKNDPNKKFNSFKDAIENVNDLQFDVIGITQFLKFHYPFYQRTFLDEIKFGYSYADGTPIFFKYDENKEGYHPKKEDALWEIILESMKEITPEAEKSYGIGNSGGLDSRVILYNAKLLGLNFMGYTFGDLKSDAIHIAQKTAKILGFENYKLEVQPNFLQEYWKQAIRCKPMFSLMFSWYLSVKNILPNFDINITGFNGDNMLGSHLNRDLVSISNKDQLYKYIYQHYSYESDEILKKVLNDKDLPMKAYLDYESHIKSSENSKNENIFEEFNFKCRQLKFIINSHNFDFCNSLQWVSPFCTQRFMKFALNLTFKERFQRKLYLNMARKHFELTKDLRFERDYMALNDGKISLFVKKALWKLDNLSRFNLYYKGSHKNVGYWLDISNANKFIYNCFNSRSEYFDDIFDRNFILNNFSTLYDNHKYLLFTLLTVKAWMDDISNSEN